MANDSRAYLKLTAIRQDFLASLQDHIDSIDPLLAGSGLTADQRKGLAARMHQLAGSAGSFGFPEVTTLAQQIEAECEGTLGQQALLPVITPALSQLQGQLTQAIASMPSEQEAEADTLPAPPPSKRKNHHLSILVVEDDVTVAELLRETLNKTATVQSCRTAEDARRLVQTSRPDLILLDHQLAGELDGLSWLEMLRSDASMRFVPVIILSGHSGKDMQARAVQAHVADFITKPFTADDIVERVQARLSLIGRNVMIVEDDASQRSMLKHIFRCFGCTVSLARSGEQALSHATASQPDLVIMDQWLPDQHGTDVARSLRQRNDKARKMPIIFVSARPDANSVKGSAAVGGTDFLLKPVPMHRLLKSCSDALQQ